MTSITGSYLVALINTHVSSHDARRLLNEAHDITYYYREPLGFVGEVTILWDNSKVDVSGFTGHNMDMSYIIKVHTLVNHLTLDLELCPFSTRHTSSATMSAEPANLGSTSDSSELDFTCDFCAMETYTFNCELDAVIFEDIVTSAPSEKDTDLVIFYDCGKPTNIIPAQDDKYRRNTRKCKHFQWVDGRLTRADKISIRNLRAENRSLRADLLIATTALCRDMDPKMGVKLPLPDGMRGQLMSTCVRATALIVYVMIFTSVLI
ncbi:hypothetical protein Cgig2_032844 [Carnegiea gigantea]|uniref:Uncharacterized protein n=1 Tax=Carnegiea gigantea TaxID=171969 RepID=A0A9Q1GZ93_9CARY|nr:hypothetical protein Cgig2_032844 [Carnegiea gigantea]